MLNYAGEVLLALGLVLFSLLSYWLVWKLNGSVQFPEPQSNFEPEKNGLMGRDNHTNPGRFA
jgi:hypothetical protein